MAMRDLIRRIFPRIATSIRYRIRLTMLLLSAATIFVLLLISYGAMERLYLNELYRDTDSELQQAGATIEHELNSIYDDIRLLAGNLIVSNALNDTDGRKIYLDPFFKSFRHSGGTDPASIALCDYAGKVLSATSQPSAGCSEPLMLDKVIHGGMPYVTIIHNGTAPLLVAAFPVISPLTGQPEGFLMSEVDLQRFLYQKMGTHTQKNDRNVAVTAGGAVLASLNENRDMQRINLKRPLKLTGQLASLDMTLQFNEAGGHEKGLLVTVYLIVGGLIFLATFFISGKLADSISARILVMNDNIQVITASGDTDRPVTVSGDDEIRQLGDAFNTLMAKLDLAHLELEDKVEERTRHLAEANERNKQLIAELQDAIANIRTLRGLIPICSACKKIRSDSGAWQQIEQYIAENSDAEFSHGLCQDCMNSLYGDYLQTRHHDTDEGAEAPSSSC